MAESVQVTLAGIVMLIFVGYRWWKNMIIFQN